MGCSSLGWIEMHCHCRHCLRLRSRGCAELQTGLKPWTVCQSLLRLSAGMYRTNRGYRLMCGHIQGLRSMQPHHCSTNLCRTPSCRQPPSNHQTVNRTRHLHHTQIPVSLASCTALPIAL